MSLIANKISYHVQGRKLLDDVSLQAQPGELHAILGPNGAGKSSLLRVLSGEWKPSDGDVTFCKRPLVDWPLQELARWRAVLPQQESLRFTFKVHEVVALGRLPHKGQESSCVSTEAIVDAALGLAGVAHLSLREYPTLSGGERARVQLARVLAQIWEAPPPPASRYLLLDEPTANLDLAHQHHCMRVARDLSRSGIAVLAVLHDPNLVLNYADRVTVLCCGQQLASGAPAEVLNPELLSQVYGLPVQILEARGTDQRWIQISRQR